MSRNTISGRNASAACKADPARLESARRATVELQDGRPGYRALWRHFVKVSEIGLARETGSLGVRFDLWNGESSVQDALARAIRHTNRPLITQVFVSDYGIEAAEEFGIKLAAK